MDVNELIKDKTPVATYANGKLNWGLDRDINAVYCIVFGDDFYIGSTEYVYRRIKDHLSALNRGAHSSNKMQRLFNEGKDFTIYTLERGVEPSRLVSAEMEYIKNLNPTLNVYRPINVRTDLLVETILKERGMTKTALSETLGIKKQNLNAMLKNPTLDTINRLANALEIPTWRLFVTPNEIISDILKRG